MTCVGDLAGLSLDDALFAATTGDVATADRALEAAVAEGAAPVQVLRAALGHLQKLHRARLAMDEQGLGAADAVKGIRPPVFYQKVGAFTRSLGLWPAATLTRGDGGVGRGRTGVQANRLAGSGALPERGADAGASIGGGVSFGAKIGWCDDRVVRRWGGGDAGSIIINSIYR